MKTLASKDYFVKHVEILFNVCIVHITFVSKPLDARRDWHVYSRNVPSGVLMLASNRLETEAFD